MHVISAPTGELNGRHLGNIINLDTALGNLTGILTGIQHRSAGTVTLRVMLEYESNLASDLRRYQRSGGNEAELISDNVRPDGVDEQLMLIVVHAERDTTVNIQVVDRATPYPEPFDDAVTQWF